MSDEPPVDFPEDTRPLCDWCDQPGALSINPGKGLCDRCYWELRRDKAS